MVAAVLESAHGMAEAGGNAGCVELGVPLMIGAKCAKTSPARKSEKPCARDPQFITFSSH